MEAPGDKAADSRCLGLHLSHGGRSVSTAQRLNACTGHSSWATAPAVARRVTGGAAWEWLVGTPEANRVLQDDDRVGTSRLRDQRY